jgi:hypothetical protein
MVSSHLPHRSQVVLEPCKSLVRARSAASVKAILQATIHVLRKAGKERLTTTRVALRAGCVGRDSISVLPEQSALLQAALKRHLAEVTEAVELVCKKQEGEPLRQMVTALITTFLQAKMRDAKTSVALNSVSSDGRSEDRAAGAPANRSRTIHPPPRESGIFHPAPEKERRRLPAVESHRENRLTSGRPAKSSHHADCRQPPERTETVSSGQTEAESNFPCAPD